MSFWGHLEELRRTLFRVVAVLLVFMIACFCVMPDLFDSFVLGPTTSDFFLYRWLSNLGGTGMAALEAGAGEQDLFPHLPPPCGGHSAGTFGRHYPFGRSAHADGRLPAALPALRTGYPDRPGVAGCGAVEKRESIVNCTPKVGHNFWGVL